MKLCFLFAAATTTINPNLSGAFSPPLRYPESFSSSRLIAASTSSPAVDESALSSSSSSSSPRAVGTLKAKTKTLGLLTFNLDDSLYPIMPVIQDANSAFVRAMANYGYNLEPDAIVESATRIREEAGPAMGSAMTHTAVRLLAIRREMEKKMVENKLRECAEDWATEVSSLTGPMRRSAEKGQGRPCRTGSGRAFTTRGRGKDTTAPRGTSIRRSSPHCRG